MGVLCPGGIQSCRVFMELRMHDKQPSLLYQGIEELAKENQVASFTILETLSLFSIW